MSKSNTLNELMDLQKKYEDLFTKYEQISLENKELNKTQNFGAIFIFEDETTMKIPIFGTTRGIKKEGTRPIKVFVNFTTDMIMQWTQDLKDTLAGNVEKVVKMEDLKEKKQDVKKTFTL